MLATWSLMGVPKKTIRLRSSIEKIFFERKQNGRFHNLVDFVRRVNIHKKQVETLIKVGAFDNFGLTQPELLSLLDGTYGKLQPETPELFERYLPYALALDVEQAWAERFSDVLARAKLLLEGQVRARMNARDARIRARHQGQVIKFEFLQGYNFRKDPTRIRPFLEELKSHQIDSFDQGVFWGGKELDEAEFERFEKVCGLAGELGLNTWATLVPPSGNRDLAALGVEPGRELYRTVFRRLAGIARGHRNFIGVTIDDFDYNLGFFSPEFCAELARVCRSVKPELAFMPLMYWRGLHEEFMEQYAPYVDGLVFHFRAESRRAGYIPDYDPKSFAHYRHVLHYELSRARRLLGGKTLICGLYQWYYNSGWGVMTPDGKNPSASHQCKDVRQKYEVAYEYADGVRLYGLGIGAPVYDTLRQTMQEMKRAGKKWGWRGPDVAPYQPPGE